MHVLIIPSWYPRYSGDVEGSFFRDQALALAASGAKVGVLFADLLGPGRYFKSMPHSGITVTQDGPIHEVRSRGFNWFSHSDVGYNWLATRHLGKIAKNYVRTFGKPDIIHAHSMLPGGWFARIMSDELNIPYVLTEHSSVHLKQFSSRYFNRKFRDVAAGSASNFAVSESFAALLNQKYGDGWSYLPNMVADRFLSLPFGKGRDNSFSIVSAGNLVEGKRMDLVIDALAILRRRDIDAHLTIIGDGPERAGLERLVEKLSLRQLVKFAGKVAVQDMPRAMSGGDLLVSASDAETFGVTLVEALALGMPVVATRSGGPESIVSPEVGILVNRDNAAELADAMAFIFDNRGRYKREDMRSYCIDLYSSETISRKLVECYREKISNG